MMVSLLEVHLSHCFVASQTRKSAKQHSFFSVWQRRRSNRQMSESRKCPVPEEAEDIEVWSDVWAAAKSEFLELRQQDELHSEIVRLVSFRHAPEKEACQLGQRREGLAESTIHLGFRHQRQPSQILQATENTVRRNAQVLFHKLQLCQFGHLHEPLVQILERLWQTSEGKIHQFVESTDASSDRYSSESQRSQARQVRDANRSSPELKEWGNDQIKRSQVC